MFSLEMSDTTSYLFQRKTLTSFFPTLFFWSGLLAVYASLEGLEETLQWWLSQSSSIQVLQVIAALVWVAFSAHLLGSHLSWITRQQEGYWKWPFSHHFYSWRQKYYQKVLKSLEPRHNPSNNSSNRQADQDYEEIYYRFPFPDEPDEVMPTRLGNILKNSELYSYHRYDIDAVLMWPRLVAVLPESFIDPFQQARSALDLLVVVSFLSGLFTFAASLLVLSLSGPPFLFVGCLLGGVLLTRIAYQGTLEAALTYSQLVKSAFDLYRGQLIEQLGYEQPTTLHAERCLWQNICQLIYRSEPQEHDRLRYKGAAGSQNRSPCPDNASSAALAPRQDVSIRRQITRLVNALRQMVAQRSLTHLSLPTLRQKMATLWQDIPLKEEKLITTVTAYALLLIFAGLGYWYLSPSAPQMTTVYVPTRDLPAYHLITSSDFTTSEIPLAERPEQALLSEKEWLHHYTHSPLSAQVITQTQLLSFPTRHETEPPRTSLTDTLPVSIPATPAMAYNGQLTSGMVVSVWSVPMSGTASATPFLPQVLVLDVQKVSNEPATEASSHPYVIVLAIPTRQQSDVMAAARADRLSLTLVRSRE